MAIGELDSRTLTQWCQHVMHTYDTKQVCPYHYTLPTLTLQTRPSHTLYTHYRISVRARLVWHIITAQRM